MDDELLTIIKQEKEKLLNNNDLKDVQVKEENENFEGWYIRNGQSGYQEYQENIRYKELKEEYVYNCTSCDEVFSNEISLYKHNLLHLKVPLYKNQLYICDICYYYSKNKSHLEEHILTKHKTHKISSKLYECKICNRTFKYCSWWAHKKNVHSKAEFKCDMCNMVFKCQRYLNRHHLFIHEGVKRNKYKREKCPKCPVNTNTKHALALHMRNCHSAERFQCKICMSTLNCKENLLKHMKTVHYGDVHSCGICTRTFKCKTYLLVHMKRVHYDDGEVHGCSICSKTFKSPLYLKLHMKNHHKVKVGKMKKKFLNM